MPIPDISDSPMELTDSVPAPVEKPVDPTPSPEVTPPAEPKKEEPVVDPAKPENSQAPVLYDLPDGRKVDAATLAKEFKENFLPDYTRKSQKIAEYEKGNPPQDKKINNPPTDAPKWKDPNYVPENYAEVIQIAKAEAIQEMESKAQAEIDRVNSIKTAVETDLAELKAQDPKLDEDALFKHANKYRFQDLKTAHANMKDIAQAALDAEQRTLKNVKAREADPIAGGDSGNSPGSDGVDMNELSGFSNAVEFFQRAKGGK